MDGRIRSMGQNPQRNRFRRPQSQHPVPLPRTVDILGLSKRKGAAAKDCSSECQLRDPCGSGSGQKPWSMRYEENSGKHKKKWILARKKLGYS